MKGIMITVEGPDGAGKTTIAKALVEKLNQYHLTALFTREPGGTKISESIRELLLDKNNSEMVLNCEVLLFAAARSQHFHQLIKPSLLDGKIVVVDRFIDSSLVYQSYAQGADLKMVKLVNAFATDDFEDYLTIYLDIPSKLQKARLSYREFDRLESHGDSFMEMVNQGYQEIIKNNPQRIIRVDASNSVDSIVMDIIRILKDRDERFKVIE